MRDSFNERDFPPPRPDRPKSSFPNLRAREAVKAIVESIIETVNHVRMTEAEQKVFVLGVLRGSITLLRAECEPEEVQYSALPFLLEILDQFNQHGVSTIRALAERITGQVLREAKDAQVVADLLPPLESLGGAWHNLEIKAGTFARGSVMGASEYDTRLFEARRGDQSQKCRFCGSPDHNVAPGYAYCGFPAAKKA